MGTIAEVRDTIITMLTAGMGLTIKILRNGTIVVEWADYSTAVFIHLEQVESKGDAAPETFLHVTAPILRGVTESPELYKWIATEGAGYRLGCIEAYPEEGGTLAVHYKYAMLADYLDEQELSAALTAVIATANGIDEDLQQKFGGKRFVDED